MSQARLKGVDRAQLFRTVDVERLIPDDHPARAIGEFVGRLDLSGYTELVCAVAGVAGGSAPSENVQVSTDAAHGVIVDIEATQAGSDYQQLTPATERIEQSMRRAPSRWS